MHESAQTTVFGDHAMTGNDDGDAIRATRLPHRAGSGVQLRSDIGIAAGFAPRNLLNRLPYPALVSSATDVQRQIKSKTGIGKVSL